MLTSVGDDIKVCGEDVLGVVVDGVVGEVHLPRASVLQTQQGGPSELETCEGSGWSSQGPSETRTAEQQVTTVGGRRALTSISSSCEVTIAREPPAALMSGMSFAHSLDHACQNGHPAVACRVCEKE